jgi:GNAT superfamily N-acetyltransferase
MSDDLTFRPFAPDDLPAMQQVRKAAYAPVFQSFRDIVGPKIAAIAFARADEEHAEYLEGLCKPEDGRHMFVALLNGALVGFCAYTMNREKRTGEIGLNAVHPDHGNRGVGARMYQFAIDRMKEAGLLLVEVGAGGDPSHAPARRAYEKAGFGPRIPSVSLYRLL